VPLTVAAVFESRPRHKAFTVGEHHETTGIPGPATTSKNRKELQRTIPFAGYGTGYGTLVPVPQL